MGPPALHPSSLVPFSYLASLLCSQSGTWHSSHQGRGLSPAPGTQKRRKQGYFLWKGAARPNTTCPRASPWIHNSDNPDFSILTVQGPNQKTFSQSQLNWGGGPLTHGFTSGSFHYPRSTEVQRQMILLLMSRQKVSSGPMLHHSAYVIHLTSPHHVGISSHVITHRRVSAVSKTFWGREHIHKIFTTVFY